MTQRAVKQRVADWCYLGIAAIVNRIDTSDSGLSCSHHTSIKSSQTSQPLPWSVAALFFKHLPRRWSPSPLSSSQHRHSLHLLGRTPRLHRFSCHLCWNYLTKPKAYGIIGHSLGCGTALQTGDNSWTRVLIAGQPPAIAALEVEASTFAPFTSRAAWKSFALSQNAPLLFISSVNNCTIKFGGGLAVPPTYELLNESHLSSLAPPN